MWLHGKTPPSSPIPPDAALTLLAQHHTPTVTPCPVHTSSSLKLTPQHTPITPTYIASDNSGGYFSSIGSYVHSILPQLVTLLNIPSNITV